MHHASSTVGALAAALAKAQSELLNPEKSLIGTVLSSGTAGPERTFRYAPLSSGLEIIRKTLGRHEIATFQTTDIDDGASLIRLTTILAHSSGEWISSVWPVCPVSETAAPHRLGAALTYARRYALFTLVGIAGDDDTDAPDLPLASPREIRESAPALTKVSPEKPREARSPHRRSRPTPKPALASEASAILRRQLEAELSGVASMEELTAWATRSLPSKNSLTPEDSGTVEEAFAKKLVTLEAAPAKSSQARTNPEAQIQGSSEPALMSDNDPAGLAIPRTIRRRDKRHLKFVASQPCLVCGRRPSDAHHLRFAEPRALGRKVSDEFTVPLCRGHHRALHDRGDEKTWWTEIEIDPAPFAERLWTATR
jgi:hypothetical protein